TGAEFKKEQLKVTFVQATRALRVSGERPLSDNRRSRFNVAFAVPNNCDATQIQGKFQDGVLLLTMPQFPSTSTTPPAPAAAAPPPVAPQPVVKEEPPHPLAPPPPATAVNQQEAPQSKAATAPEVKDTPNKNDQSKSEHGHDAKIVPPATESKPPPPPLDREKEGKVPDNNNNPIKSEADRPQVAGTTSSKKRKQSSSVAAAATATEEIKDEFDGEGVMSSGIKKRKEELTAAAKDAAESTSTKVGEIGERVKESAAAVVKSTAETSGKGQMGIKERMDELMREENRQAVVGMSLAVIAAVAVGAFVIYRYRSSSS
ncbi:Inactive protein RESTRICTED TEV MOVEMENT 2, partial [Linum grandiflorum]